MKKNKNKKGSFLKKILAIIFLIIICLSIYIIKSGYDIYKGAIASMPISKKVDEVSSSDSYVTLDNIPKTYQEATILIEDKRFYSHQGVDIISIGRAIIKDISTLSLAEGGSTITQQVAKNLYLTQEKNFTRKVAEVFLATKLEEELSKEKILELYLNIIYYGDGYYGIQNASYGYFGKAPASLNLNEQTILVGLPNAPSVYQLSNNSNLTKKRQEIVIKTMADAGQLTDDQIKEIESEKNKGAN